MNNGQYSVEVLVNGRPVREFTHSVNGETRTFIEGRNGTQYSLRVRNHSNQRVLAIASVDGLNVVSGDIGDGFKGRGYIIKPNDSVVIKGFRESDKMVGTFQFTTKEESYAQEQGLERNVGVIACNILDEKQRPVQVTKVVEHHHHHYPKPEPEPMWSRRKGPEPYWGDSVPVSTSDFGSEVRSGGTSFTASLGNGSNATPTNGGQMKRMVSSKGGQHVNSIERKSSFDMGTKWGQRQEHRIQRAHFDKNRIVATFSIYYASRGSLENMGIKFYEEDQIDSTDLPNGFEGYCKPPKDWNKNLPCRPDGGRDGSGLMF